MRPLIICICSILHVLTGAAYAVTLQQIQKAYEGLKDMQGSFVQRSHIKDLGRTDVFKGTFMMKFPAKMRWQYSGDDRNAAEVIINNDEIIVYKKNEKQAFKSRFDKATYGMAPIALLGGIAEIDKEFDVSNKDGKLLLRPKKAAGTIIALEIIPSEGEFPIASLTIFDSHSNRIEIIIKNITLNKGLDDRPFNFSLPKGASMHEAK